MTLAVQPLSSVFRLPQGGAGTAPDVVEHVHDVIQRWRNGEPADARAFLAQHPEVKANKSLAQEVIYEEFYQRLDKGEWPPHDEYLEKFPSYRFELRRFFDAHRAVQEQWAAHATAGVDEAARQAEAAQVPWPKSGEPFSSFLLLNDLGRGAFARAYLAIEPALGNRYVAVKVSRRGGAEAQTLGKLNHPNIVPVFSVQEEAASQLTVVCMPYLGSATLCEVLVAAYDRPEFPAQAQLILDAVQDTALPPEVVIGRPRPHALLRNGSYINGVVHIGVQLANALDYVHRMGICHRDLKPSNVLMMPDGTPMLLDFNLSSDPLTAANRLGGTFPYMSPEQLLAIDPDAKAADGAHLDARSDLYSLGVILYELLTGKHPLGRVPSGQDLAKLRAYLLERQPLGIVPIRHVNPRVDRSLARAIERCLAYRPDDRGTAAELAADLRKCLSALQRLRRYIRVHPWRATAAALIIATVIGAAGAYGAAAFSAAHDPRVAQAQAQEAYRAGRFEEAISSLDKAIKADPDSAELRYARGRAFQRLGEVHSGRLGQDYMGLAIDNYLQAERLGLRDERILASKAFCFCQQSNLTDAIAALEEVIERGQPVGEMLNNLAYCYLRKKDLDKAEKALEKAFELNPSLQAAFHNRAMLDFLKAIRPTERIPESGIEDIRQAFRLGPPNAELHRDAARLYAIAAENGKNHSRKQDWTQDALNHFKKAIELGMDPKHLAKDETFQSLKNEPVFQELAARPSQQERVLNTRRVVDPISD